MTLAWQSAGAAVRRLVADAGRLASPACRAAWSRRWTARRTPLALEQLLAGWVVHAAGLLLALVLTAGLLPAFLVPHTASVLLAKPVPRCALLAGKSLGVWPSWPFHACLLVGGAWLALAAPHRRLGPDLSAVRPAAGAAFRGFLHLLGDAGGGHAQHGGLRVRDGAVLAAVLGDELRPARGDGTSRTRTTVSPAFGWVIDAGYWLLPKPLDFQLALADGAHGGWTQVLGLGRVAGTGPGRRGCRCWRRRRAAWRCWAWRPTISARRSIKRNVSRFGARRLVRQTPVAEQTAHSQGPT